MRLAARIGVTVAVVVIAGCSPDEPPASVAGTADAAVIEQEYEETKAKLELPDSASWPTLTFERDSYMVGFGTDRAYEAWLCLWSEQAVRGDRDDRSDAVETLEGFLDSEQFQAEDIGQREIFDSMISDASDGNERGLRDFLDLACDGVL